jgi:hypothetical protein
MKNLFILPMLFALTTSGYCQANKCKQELIKPFILGEIQEFQSTILDEKRILNIYLPDSYNPKDSLKYPVIYLLDGSADEDFIHIVGLVQYNSLEWINLMPKSIHFY